MSTEPTFDDPTAHIYFAESILLRSLYVDGDIVQFASIVEIQIWLNTLTLDLERISPHLFAAARKTLPLTQLQDLPDLVPVSAYCTRRLHDLHATIVHLSYHARGVGAVLAHQSSENMESIAKQIISLEELLAWSRFPDLSERSLSGFVLEGSAESSERVSMLSLSLDKWNQQNQELNDLTNRVRAVCGRLVKLCADVSEQGK